MVVERLQQEAGRFIEAASTIQGRETLTQTQTPRNQRLIVSEYGFLAVQPGEIREIRQVELVDGKPAKKHGSALKDLARNLTAADDQQRRKLLESFERMDGLNGTPVAIYRYEQIDGTGGLTIYSGGKPIRQKLRGEIWVLPAGGVPVRIVLDSEFEEGKSKMRDITFVDYAPSEFGTLLPSTVVHRQFRDRTVLVEDLFRYSGYHAAQ